FRSFSDVVHHHVLVAPASLLIDNDANVGYTSAQVPGNEVAGSIVSRPLRNRKRFSFTLKEDHEIGHPAVVDVGIGMIEPPAFLVWISREVQNDLFVDFLLQVNTHRTVGPNDLVGTNSRVCGDITVRVRNSNIA